MRLPFKYGNNKKAAEVTSVPRTKAIQPMHPSHQFHNSTDSFQISAAQKLMSIT